MIEIRKSSDRGSFDHGWLSTSHSFSFGQYQDPEQMGFRSLRVINEDVILGGGGFPRHSHRDMEIITYVLKGGLRHKDSMGNEAVIEPGAFQKMSAGTGIQHSEFNASQEEPVHLYQIWIEPAKTGIEPNYEEKVFVGGEKQGKLIQVASPDGAGGTITIYQDAAIYLAELGAGDAVWHRLATGRFAWLQVLTGSVTLNGESLVAGDGAAVSDEAMLTIVGEADGEVMLFDLA